MERRWQAQYTLPPLVDLATVRRAINDVMQALLQDRIDEDYAGELLQELERASVVLRGKVG
jgi:DNA-binding FrmR family transcriptional regulator